MPVSKLELDIPWVVLYDAFVLDHDTKGHVRYFHPLLLSQVLVTRLVDGHVRIKAHDHIDHLDAQESNKQDNVEESEFQSK